MAECVPGLATTAGVDAVALADAVRIERRRFWDDVSRHRIERVNMMGAWTKIAANGLERVSAPSLELAARIARTSRRGAGPSCGSFLACRRRWPALCRRRAHGPRHQRRQEPAAAEDRDLRSRPLLRGDRDRGRVRAGKPEEIVYRQPSSVLGSRPPRRGWWAITSSGRGSAAAARPAGHLGGPRPHGPSRGHGRASHRIVREFCELLDPTPHLTLFH